MRKLTISLLLTIILTHKASTQIHYTKNGYISFYSEAPVENIKADNNQVVCILNTQNGQIQFSLLIKNFRFKNELMEEHFNENYMESNQYPKATFKGTINDIKKIIFTKNDTYTVMVEGDLIIHGISKKIFTTGTLSIREGEIQVYSKFRIALDDYNIRIPKIVKDNISSTPEIIVSCQLDNKK